MNAVRAWLEASPFVQSLGASLEAQSGESLRLLLPYREHNANPGQALHGGCAAALALIGGQAITRETLGEGSGPLHTCGLQVNYLAAAIGEDVVAEARLLRRGKTMCFVEIDVATREGKSIAHATSMVRGRFGAAPCELAISAGDDGAAEPGPMGPHIGKLNFAAERGLHIEHMTNAHSRIRMPWSEKNQCADGGVHEGAVAALFDTTGAMAAWAETGPGPYKASTPALQLQILAPSPKRDLVAYGRVVQSDGDAFWSDVEVADAAAGHIVARGTVMYRIVV